MAETECPNCEETVDAETEVCPACGYFFVDRSCERHPTREADGACVICGRALCPECNRPQGRHFSCDEHAHIPLIQGWAQVYSAGDDVEAELIRDNLEADGIESRVLSQHDHTFAIDLGDLNEVRVLVPGYEYLRAKALLDEHMDDAGEVTFACPNCGEPYEPGQVNCSACGATLPAASTSA